MALHRCDNGHYFDPAKYAACPSCAGPAQVTTRLPPGALPDLASMPARAADDGRTRRRDEAPAAPEAAAPRAAAPAAAPAVPAGSDGGRTERLVRRQTGIDPVVGWLVCVAGPERGNDYRLHTERNFIGRGEAMDVRIAGDRTISRDNHCSLSFDPKRDSFRLLPGEARGLVYLNGEELVSASPLGPGDRIELGETTLLFVPLCGTGFRWAAPAPEDTDA
jgi:hypothetical protein